MTLHIFNQSPNNASLLRDMLAALSKEDAIILIEDGVITALKAFCAEFNPPCPVYALEADIQARGFTELVTGNIQIVSDDEFVQLCCMYHKTLSWL